MGNERKIGIKTRCGSIKKESALDIADRVFEILEQAGLEGNLKGINITIWPHGGTIFEKYEIFYFYPLGETNELKVEVTWARQDKCLALVENSFFKGATRKIEKYISLPQSFQHLTTAERKFVMAYALIKAIEICLEKANVGSGKQVAEISRQEIKLKEIQREGFTVY